MLSLHLTSATVLQSFQLHFISKRFLGREGSFTLNVGVHHDNDGFIVGVVKRLSTEISRLAALLCANRHHLLYQPPVCFRCLSLWVVLENAFVHRADLRQPHRSRDNGAQHRQMAPTVLFDGGNNVLAELRLICHRQEMRGIA